MPSKCEIKYRPFPRDPFAPDLSAMTVNNALHGCEADSGPEIFLRSRQAEQAYMVEGLRHLALGLGVAVVFVQVLTVPLNNLILHGLRINRLQRALRVQFARPASSPAPPSSPARPRRN